jgi:hypothetical protein
MRIHRIAVGFLVATVFCGCQTHHGVESRDVGAVEDDVLGVFVLDRSVNWFEGTPLWNGRRISLDLKVGEHADVKTSLQVARELWKLEKTWNAKVLDYAASKLLKLKNDSWLSDGEASLSAGEFKKKMTLESITVSPNGDFEFWFNDGDLFWGHSIMVSGSLKDGFKDAGIHG